MYKTPDAHMEHEAEFKGPVKSRSCTDILCSLLFLTFIGGWAVVAYFGIKYGDPIRLVYPTDSEGKICGQGKLADKPVLMFFDFLQCGKPSVILHGCRTPQVCVKECPTSPFLAGPPFIPFKSFDKQDLVCKYEVSLPAAVSGSELQKLVEQQKCARWYLPSVNLFGRCIPAVFNNVMTDVININDSTLQTNDGVNATVADIVKSSKFLSLFLNAREFGEKIFRDLSSTWWLILIGLVFGAVLSFTWILLMKWIAAVMIWISMVSIIGILTFGLYYTISKYIELRNYSPTNWSVTEREFRTNIDYLLSHKETWLGLAITIGIILLILLLVLIFLRKRILIAIALIRHASKAVAGIMSSLFFPIFPFVLQLLVVAGCCFVGMYLASAGRGVFIVQGLESSLDCPQECINKYQNNGTCNPEEFEKVCSCKNGVPLCQFLDYKHDLFVYLQLYNIFALIWGLIFASDLADMILAGAFASWYWAFDKTRDVPALPLITSMGRTFRYHIGTVTFGSLIIAIIRAIRLILEYINKKVDQYKENSRIARAVMCCCRCCLWCLEKFMRFINRNAYIWCAIYGDNFCTSARKAFSLLFRNIANVAVLDKVTDFLIFLGKLVVVGAVGIPAFFVFSGKIGSLNDQIPSMNYYFVPILIIIFGTYFIASCFFDVYEMAVDTLFLCFLDDRERNDGSREKPYFMSKELQQILDLKNK